MNEHVETNLEALACILKQAIASKQAGLYHKFGQVRIRQAEPGERVVTQIDGVKETSNTVPVSGEFFVVTGPKGEEYVISKDQLIARYAYSNKPGIYLPTGKVFAVQYGGAPLKFKAAWGEDMILNTGDYLAATPDDLDHPYRIENAVFGSTYKR